MNLNQTLELLYKRRTHGIKPGLDRIEALLERMGNPERSLAAIHVAGTNGKGSVCAMIESVLRSAGFRTGIYTSPHLVCLNERMRVNGECISDDDLASLIALVDEHSNAVAEGFGEVTFFEFTTAVMFEYFRRSDVKLAVIETGMGGRLDATNVLTPLLSVITRVSLDHTDYLGETVKEIAGEKAGIIKSGRPVVCGLMDDEALQVIALTAAEHAVPLAKAWELVTVRKLSEDIKGQKLKISGSADDYPPIKLPLLGTHQAENVSLAVAALESVAESAGLAIPRSAMVDGLNSVEWRARLQVLSEDPLVMLDGAHNESGAIRLRETLEVLADGRAIGLVIGMLADKDVEAFLRAAIVPAERVWAVPVSNERTMPAEELAAFVRVCDKDAEECKLEDAMSAARQWAAESGGIVCVCGSLYLAGEVLSLRLHHEGHEGHEDHED